MDKIKEYYQSLFSRIHFGWWVFGILAFDILSFHVHYITQLQAPVFIALCVLFFVLSVKRLLFGVLLLFAELFIGSKGYLYSLEIEGIDISLRLACFVLLFLATLLWMLREKSIAFFHWSLWKPYALVACVIFFGIVIGVLRENTLSTIFFDANGYLYLGLVIPATQALRSKDDVRALIAVLYAAIIALSVKTLFLLLLFSHKAIAPITTMSIYLWVRETGVGEITEFPNGFSRIFIQSQIYMLIGIFLILPWFAYITRVKEMAQNALVRRVYILLVVCVSVVMLNYSRSFWVAGVFTMSVVGMWFLFKDRMPIKRIGALIALCITTIACAYGLIFSVVHLPLPGYSAIGDLFSQRTKNIGSEAAAASRWNLLTPLIDASLTHPLFGSGLGATLTYASQDPRVLENNPDGQYTTYAFEWGYLDFALKFGLLGLLAFGYLFFSILKKAFARLAQPHSLEGVEAFSIIAATIAIAGAHFFTPYLNHPLGIGWIILVSVCMALPYQQKK